MISLIRSILLFLGLMTALTCVPVRSVLAGPPGTSLGSSRGVDTYRVYMLMKKHPHLMRKYPSLAREVEYSLAKSALPAWQRRSAMPLRMRSARARTSARCR